MPFTNYLIALFISIVSPTPINHFTKLDHGEDTDLLLQLNDATTKGSIKGGSKSLLLQSSIGLKKGQTVIVEIGTEKGGGNLGTVGVGGSWPDTRFATEEALIADRTQTVSGIYAVAENTANVFRWNGKDAWVPFTTWHYYGSKGHSFALIEKVLDVSDDGRTVTIENKAKATAVAANVYVDNAEFLNEALNNTANSKVTLLTKGKRYAIGKNIYIKRDKPLFFDGNGCTFFSPQGAPSANFKLVKTSNSVIQNFNLQGNGKFKGFAFQKDIYPVGGAFWENPYVSAGGVQIEKSTGSVGKKISVKDVLSYSLQLGDDVDCRFENSTVYPPESLGYVGWQVHGYSSKGGGFFDVTLNAPDGGKLCSGFEFFGCTDMVMKNIRGENVVNAINGGTNIKIIGSKFVIRGNSLAKWMNMGSPVWDLNGQFNGVVFSGIQIEDMEITQLGFQNGNLLLNEIYGRDLTPNVSVKNFKSTFPDAVEGTNPHLSVFLWADGARVENAVINGKFPAAFYVPKGAAGAQEPYVYGANIALGYAAVKGKGLGKGYLKNNKAEFMYAKEGIELKNNTYKKMVVEPAN